MFADITEVTATFRQSDSGKMLYNELHKPSSYPTGAVHYTVYVASQSHTSLNQHADFLDFSLPR